MVIATSHESPGDENYWAPSWGDDSYGILQVEGKAAVSGTARNLIVPM